jgi:hypothetical protein
MPSVVVLALDACCAKAIEIVPVPVAVRVPSATISAGEALVLLPVFDTMPLFTVEVTCEFVEATDAPPGHSDIPTIEDPAVKVPE